VRTGSLCTRKEEPVGWCQYGSKEELPRIDNSRKYRGLAPRRRHTETLEESLALRFFKKCRKTRDSERCVEAALEVIRKKEGARRAYPSLAGKLGFRK